MKTLIAIFGATVGTVIIFCHLFKRMLNGFDCPEVEIEFWERNKNDSHSKRTR